MSGADFYARTRDALARLSMDGDVASIDRMLQYLDLLQRWNRTYNLTAIRDPERMLVQHIFDSLAVVPWLRGAGLDNVQSVHGRIEALEPLGADLIISRAFASLADYASLCAPHLAESGMMAAMKGYFPEAEQYELEHNTDWRVREIVNLEVPELDAHRCLIRLGLKDAHDR